MSIAVRVACERGENLGKSVGYQVCRTRSALCVRQFSGFLYIFFNISFGNWFEPRGISYLFGMIVWVKVSL